MKTTRLSSVKKIPNEALQKQHIPAPGLNWPELRNFSLSYELAPGFTDADKVRQLSLNAWESYLEYGKMREMELDELRTILYFYAKKYESDTHGPSGQELKFLLTLLKKLRTLV